MKPDIRDFIDDRPIAWTVKSNSDPLEAQRQAEYTMRGRQENALLMYAAAVKRIADHRA